MFKALLGNTKANDNNNSNKQKQVLDAIRHLAKLGVFKRPVSKQVYLHIQHKTSLDF
ncbi:MAG: hypothetical protein O3C63_06490 [Cyanobacteria bacterium]|nr:hypothetical protein [Cyanobacteriota bacterium]MDA1020115.1 hypothetical protein [Cyanobacteriota bacterium]